MRWISAVLSTAAVVHVSHSSVKPSALELPQTLLGSLLGGLVQQVPTGSVVVNNKVEGDLPNSEVHDENTSDSSEEELFDPEAPCSITSLAPGTYIGSAPGDIYRMELEIISESTISLTLFLISIHEAVFAKAHIVNYKMNPETCFLELEDRLPIPGNFAVLYSSDKATAGPVSDAPVLVDSLKEIYTKFMSLVNPMIAAQIGDQIQPQVRNENVVTVSVVVLQRSQNAWIEFIQSKLKPKGVLVVPPVAWEVLNLTNTTVNPKKPIVGAVGKGVTGVTHIGGLVITIAMLFCSAI